MEALPKGRFVAIGVFEEFLDKVVRHLFVLAQQDLLESSDILKWNLVDLAGRVYFSTQVKVSGEMISRLAWRTSSRLMLLTRSL